MKNPTILEGGIARVFSGIRKLFTRQSGSDDMIAWVPESERQLTTKYITQNGVYRASDDGYYAYSSVTVSVPTDTGVTGEGEDGEQHYVAPDPETGELIDEVIPSSIVVETPPTNPYGIYKDGQAIGKGGMVVKAYYADGTEWGVVLNDEIVLVPDIAEYDPDKDIRILTGNGIVAYGYIGHMQYRFYSPWVAPVGRCVYIGVFGSTSVPTKIEDNPEPVYPTLLSDAGVESQVLYLTQYNDSVYAACDPQMQSNTAFGTILSGPTTKGYGPKRAGSKFGLAGASDNPDAHDAFVLSLAPTSTTSPDGVDIGDLDASQRGATQTINVEWQRPGDGAVLSAAFEILVAPPIYGGGEA